MDHVVFFFGNESAVQSFRTFTFELVTDINWGQISEWNWTVKKNWKRRSRKEIDENDRLIWNMVAHLRPQIPSTVSDRELFFKKPSGWAQDRPFSKDRSLYTSYQIFLGFTLISNLFKTKAGFQNNALKFNVWTLVGRPPTQSILWLAEWSKGKHNFETPPKRIPLFKFTASYIKKTKKLNRSMWHFDFHFATSRFWIWNMKLVQASLSTSSSMSNILM